MPIFHKRNLNMRLHSISAFLFAAILCGSCSNEKAEKTDQILRIATADDPLSLDPRLVRDLPTVTIMRLLFEGLMRTNSSGVLEPAVAENVIVSEDKMTYTFTLRTSQWSDGTPLTAKDFEQTWKTILAPEFPAPNAYQLFLIKGAKDAKEGRIPLAEIGVKANGNTLVVELEQPAPYFLELTSCHFYFPVHGDMRLPNASKQSIVVGNGPFAIDHWHRRNEFSVLKNPHYWDAQSVKLAGVKLQVLDENTAFQLFKSGEIDWTGSPLSTLPQDAIAFLKSKGDLKVAPGAGTHWFRFNTSIAPFENGKMRRAFALALDRQSIVDHVTQGNQLPAIGIVPPALGISEQKYYADHDKLAAQKLFEEALVEIGTNKQDLRVSLYYAANDRNHKIAQAVQQQWNKTFDIDIALESSEAKVLLDKMRTGSYQISLGSWYADIQDPINFLEIFKSKTNLTNQTYWENPAFTQLLERSEMESSGSRIALLAEAEKILIDGMPVAPLFHSAFNYLKNDHFNGVYFSPLGYLDFKDASMNRGP